MVLTVEGNCRCKSLTNVSVSWKIDDWGPVYRGKNIFQWWEVSSWAFTIVVIPAFCKDSIEFNRLYMAISLAMISLEKSSYHQSQDECRISPKWSNNRDWLISWISQILFRWKSSLGKSLWIFFLHILMQHVHLCLVPYRKESVRQVSCNYPRLLISYIFLELQYRIRVWI